MILDRPELELRSSQAAPTGSLLASSGLYRKETLASAIVGDDIGTPYVDLDRTRVARFPGLLRAYVDYFVK